MYPDIAMKTPTVCTSAPKRVSPAAELLEALRHAQDETHDLISQIAALMEDALAPEYPSKCADPSETGSAPPSPLCCELRARIDAERVAQLRLRSLYDRITV